MSLVTLLCVVLLPAAFASTLSEVVELNVENYEQTSDGIWLVEFYAPCAALRQPTRARPLVLDGPLLCSTGIARHHRAQVVRPLQETRPHLRKGSRPFPPGIAQDSAGRPRRRHANNQLLMHSPHLQGFFLLQD